MYVCMYNIYMTYLNFSILLVEIEILHNTSANIYVYITRASGQAAGAPTK